MTYVIDVVCSCQIYTGIKVRVYCQIGKANQGNFALNVAVKTLELYKEYVLLSVICTDIDHFPLSCSLKQTDANPYTFLVLLHLQFT